MGSKNSKSFNQETLDMLKNGSINQYDLNRLINNNMPSMNFHPNSSNLNGTRFHPMIPGNNVGSIGYPPKPPRQPGEPNIMMTGSLGGSRMSLINGNEINSKSHVNYPRQLKYDSAGNLVPMFDGPSKVTSSSMYNTGTSKTQSKETKSIQDNIHETQGSQHPSKSTLLQELLECPICMNLYDNPHVLPCQHTFCKKCIISLQNNNAASTSSALTSIDCPICREKHTLVNGVEGLAANYTMKRLIELDAMQVASEKEKQLAAALAKEKTEREELSKEIGKALKAKCFSCQKFAYLKVCSHCSYTLCFDCAQNPDHDIIIESKINSKKYLHPSRPSSHSSFRVSRHESTSYRPTMEYSKRRDVYSNGPKTSPLSVPSPIPELSNPQSHYAHSPPRQPHSSPQKLKLILLCHSSAVETSLEENFDKNDDKEVYQDEYGKCSTFSKINISTSDRVITLKKIIENRFGIACNDQILVYKDKILNNDLKLLSHYKLRQFSRIHIFDERDIKEGDGNEDDALYGVYQQANFSQIENECKALKRRTGKNITVEDDLPMDNSASASDFSDEDKLEQIHRPSRYGPPVATKSPRHKQPLQKLPIDKKKPADTGSAFSSTRSVNYYTVCSNRYRRLDEIFDHQMNIGQRSNSNY